MVRYRVDGRLQDKPYAIPLSALPGLISRIKVLASLDISERRLPQDGKLRVRYADRSVDVRVSTFPTSMTRRRSCGSWTPAGWNSGSRTWA